MKGPSFKDGLFKSQHALLQQQENGQFPPPAPFRAAQWGKRQPTGRCIEFPDGKVMAENSGHHNSGQVQKSSILL